MSIQNDGEYGSPVTKTKISRARKMVIGMLAVGTAVALGGAGTFASFSASTTNDATFSTENLKMINNGTCDSDEGATVIDNSGGASSNDSNCGSLLTATENDLGTEYTKTVVLTNAGTEGHRIFLWNSGTCVANATASAGIAGDGDLCSAAKVAIKRTASSGSTQTVACIFPSGACDSAETDGGSITTFNSTVGNSFGTKTEVTNADLPANGTVTYQIKFFVAHHSSCGVAAGQDYDRNASGTDNQTVANGGLFSSGGVSCDNHYINKKAELLLKWWMESAN